LLRLGRDCVQPLRGETGQATGARMSPSASKLPHHSQRALRAVPIHANSELYHMLRLMSKQTFREKLFTCFIRNILLTSDCFKLGPFIQLIFLYELTTILLKGAALDLVPFCLSNLFFSVSASVHLTLLETTKTGLSTSRPRGLQPALPFTARSLPRSSTEGGVR